MKIPPRFITEFTEFNGKEFFEFFGDPRAFEVTIFAPTVMIKAVSGDLGADINLNCFIYKRMWLGVFYRAGYGPGALMQFYATNKLRFFFR